MAIFIVGKTQCPLCEQIIEEGEEIVSFPPFIPNDLDPLWIFSDGVFHAACFYREPLANKAVLRYEELRQKNGPGNRICVVCSSEIKDPDEYITLGHLTEDEKHPLFKYNYAQVHRSCLSKWSEVPFLCQEIRQLSQSGTWGGKALEKLIADLSCSVALDQ